MKLKFKGNCMAVRYFVNVPSIPFQMKLSIGVIPLKLEFHPG